MYEKSFFLFGQARLLMHAVAKPVGEQRNRNLKIRISENAPRTLKWPTAVEIPTIVETQLSSPIIVWSGNSVEN